MADSAAAPLVRGILFDLALNTTVPLLLYLGARREFHAREFTALAIATTFPALKALVDFTRKREFDPITLLVLGGIVVSAVSLWLGGSPRLLLIRESFLTAGFGLACLGSLLARRPMMFYLGRHFLAGADPMRRARYERSWAYADVRRAQRRITTVWGLVFLGELAARIAMAYRLPAAVVLVAAPALMAALVIGTLIWTFRIAAAMQARVLERLAAEDAARVGTEAGGGAAHPIAEPS